MSWKRWKLGLLVAGLSSLVDGAAVGFVDPQIAFRALAFILILSLAKGMGMFLKQHPVETVTGDTEILRKAVVESGRTNAGGPGSNGIVPAWGLAFVAVFALSGCTTLLDKAAGAVSSPVVTERVVTNTVPQLQIVTNVVREIVQLPGEINTVTNLVREVVTNTIQVTRVETAYVTNYVEKPSLANGLKLAETGAAFVPPPYGTAATGVLGILSAGLVLLVRRKNAQAGALAEQNDSLTTQLQAVVKGVEQVTTVINPQVGEQVKNIIAQTSKALGVADDLHASVAQMTKV